VAFLGTPESIAQRIHMVVASGSEALIPRFSTDGSSKADEKLFWSAIWSALSLSAILLIPFCVLVPDFLRLWINADFARQSGMAGRLLGVYLVWQGAFAPVAAYFRGTGRPWFVTAVILLALVVTVLMGLSLIPKYGVEGAAYAYLAGSIAPLLGVIVGGLYAFGRSAIPALMNFVGLPVAAGAVTFVAGALLRRSFGELNWFDLIAQWVLLLSLGALLIIGGDWIVGGQAAPSRQLLERILNNRRFAALMKLIPARSAS
jgi:O-antigen/teichoic acid export membrane protein